MTQRWGRSWPAVFLVLALGAGVALGLGAGQSDQQQKRVAGSVSGQVGTQPPAERAGRQARRGTAAYYRRTARKRVRVADAREFLPLHREAGRRYGVSWRLLASIHRQETAFSQASTTYHGLNDFGCCAGPMQFNVTNGPVSTWKLYRHAYRAGGRPKRYPHRMRRHPSIYDDFDAIMAAASLLRDSGAGDGLDERAWRAAYGYYGHDLFGTTYASEVLARAVGWERDGFCPNCALDPSLVERFDRAYGRSARRALLADERRLKVQKLKARRRARAARATRERRRRAQAERRRNEREAQRAPARKRPAAPPRAPEDEPADPATTQTTPAEPAVTSTTPAQTTTAAPPPPPPPCSAVEKLLETCPR